MHHIMRWIVQSIWLGFGLVDHDPSTGLSLRDTKVIIVETREADCIFRSVQRGDGGMEVGEQELDLEH